MALTTAHDSDISMLKVERQVIRPRSSTLYHFRGWMLFAAHSPSPGDKYDIVSLHRAAYIAVASF